MTTTTHPYHVERVPYRVDEIRTGRHTVKSLYIVVRGLSDKPAASSWSKAEAERKCEELNRS